MQALMRELVAVRIQKLREQLFAMSTRHIQQMAHKIRVVIIGKIVLDMYSHDEVQLFLRINYIHECHAGNRYACWFSPRV